MINRFNYFVLYLFLIKNIYSLSVVSGVKWFLNITILLVLTKTFI